MLRMIFAWRYSELPHVLLRGMVLGAAPFTVRSTPNFENTNGVEQNTIT